MKKPYFVYYLYFENGSIADVGRSSDPQCRRRVKQRKHGLVFDIEISKPMSFKDACAFEIAELLRLEPPLSKRVISSPGAYGKKMPHSLAHIAALTANHVGMFGLKHTEAAKIKMRGRVWTKAQRKAARSRRLGKRHTPETKAKLSALKMGHTLSAEARRKISEARTGSKASDETRAKMSAAHKGRPMHPKVRAALDKWNRKQAAMAKKRKSR